MTTRRNIIITMRGPGNKRQQYYIRYVEQTQGWDIYSKPGLKHIGRVNTLDDVAWQIATIEKPQ